MFSGRSCTKGTNSGTVRIHFIFNNLDLFAADSISASFCYLRQITECAADLILIKSSLWQESSLRCPFLKKRRFPAQVPFSVIGGGRNCEMKIRTAAETLLWMFYAPRCVITDLSSIEKGLR
jgi:hypothetical protein